MKADPAAQLKLLDVQALDARADLLRHQLDSLPELEEIAALQATRTELVDQARDARIVVDDLTVEQKKVDADVEQVKARRKRDQDRIDQGLISNPKDIERMQHEMVSLERRITSLEDDELEIMASVEDAQRTLDSLAAQQSATDERLAVLLASRDEKGVDIEAELARLVDQRATEVEGLPEDLLALYDKLRSNRRGVGAAELRQRRCTGCQLTIDPAELEKIRKSPEDLVVRCEECSRILVRSPESGL
ncbi:zinc ribbon domain-containing protein [Nocardioides luti]|uniref:zinc ribbon domain-containing protein n=1 Tax=Nocardioides luti TaxID=2761101 RepID=UPI003CCCAF9B